MTWTVFDNISQAGKWLKRKIELIEEKGRLLQAQASRGSPYIVLVHRGAVFDAELGLGNIGGEKNKTRPVVVLTPDRLNKGHTVVVVPLSTQFLVDNQGLPKYQNHYLLRKSDYPFLAKDSVTKFEDIRSIDVVRLRQRRGDISKEDMRRMKKAILFTLGY
ncbi:MAG: type II toxin-antitoxin system PemK/MazF family toxin [Acutalibacter sp.]|nr:type II toxin-antitoxin system PemK/MazF family toxin [Acutalibacter sp.]